MPTFERQVTPEERRQAVLRGLLMVREGRRRLRLTPGQRRHIELEGQKSLLRAWQRLPWFLRLWFAKPTVEDSEGYGK